MADPVVQNIQTNTSNLPAYAQPYFEDILRRGQAVSNQPYTPYPDQRVAGFTPAQTAAQNDAIGLQQPGQFGTASGLATSAGLGALSASQYNPTAFTNQNVTTGTFDPAAAQKYMSPYIQNVLDAQKREAVTDAQKTQLMQNLGAARQGTYGGARELLAGTERERALGQNLSDIEAKGLQSAYEAAMGQFNADQGRGLTAATSNQNADLQRQQLAEQSKQFGSSLGLQGYNTALQSAQTLGTLGNDVTDDALKRIQAKAAAGQEQQDQTQKIYDTNYADFLRQRDYPTELLNNYSALLRGVPVTPSSTATTYAPPPSTASQIGGLGLGALSLAKLMG